MSALLSNVVYLTLLALEAAVWARIILGYFFPGDDSVLSRILFTVTEPVILPFRALLNKAGKSGAMFDLSPALATLLILFFIAVLPDVTV